MGTPIDTNDLLRRIEFIERHLGIKQGVGEPFRPLGPAVWPLGPIPGAPSFVPNVVPAQPPSCTKCGLVLSGAMSYSCPQPGCPCGLGGAQCTVGGAA